MTNKFANMGLGDVLKTYFNNYPHVVQNKGILITILIIFLISFVPSQILTFYSSPALNSMTNMMTNTQSIIAMMSFYGVLFLLFNIIISLIVGFLFIMLWYGIYKVIMEGKYDINDGLKFIKSNLWGVIKTYLWYVLFVFGPPLVVSLLFILLVSFVGGGQALLFIIGVLSFLYVIYFVIRLFFVFWFMIENNVYGKKAIDKSFESTQGMTIDILFGVILIFIVVFLINLLVGVVLSIISNIFGYFIYSMIGEILGYFVSLLMFIYYFIFYKSLQAKNKAQNTA